MKSTPYTLIFGLTADPIHKGHEQVILNSFSFAKTQNIKIKEFLLVPTYHPNLIANKQQPRTAFHHRFKMCELVTKKLENQFNYPVYVTDIEQKLFNTNQQKSYSYDTLNAIKAKHKLFVLSADHFTGRWPKFRKWYKWQKLLKENGLLIHQRPGHSINMRFIAQLKTINPTIFVVSQLPQIKISSTQLRSDLRKNSSLVALDLLKLIDESVLEYINNKHIYPEAKP